MATESYWERAGRVGYKRAMFTDVSVEEHVNQRAWNSVFEISKQLGISQDSSIMDLGCGDGTFTNSVLAKHFREVDGYDISQPSIESATKTSPGNSRFSQRDVTQMDFTSLPAYDGVVMVGILHHVKPHAAKILRDLRHCTKKLIIAEPNGGHIARKLLEFTPAYRAAGEESFRTGELERMLKDAGWRKVTWKRCNLFPNFTPGKVFKLLKPLEPHVENTRGLRALCTLNLWGVTAE